MYQAVANAFVPLLRSVHDLVSAFVAGKVAHAGSAKIERVELDEEGLRGKVRWSKTLKILKT